MNQLTIDFLMSSGIIIILYMAYIAIGSLIFPEESSRIRQSANLLPLLGLAAGGAKLIGKAFKSKIGKKVGSVVKNFGRGLKDKLKLDKDHNGKIDFLEGKHSLKGFGVKHKNTSSDAIDDANIEEVAKMNNIEPDEDPNGVKGDDPNVTDKGDTPTDKPKFFSKEWFKANKMVVIIVGGVVAAGSIIGLIFGLRKKKGGKRY